MMRESIGDIAITGVGLVSCLGPDTESAWRSVLERRRVMRSFSLCESAVPKSWTGGEAPNPRPGVLPLAPREVRLLRCAIDEAVARARLVPESGRVAAVLGTTLHGMRRAGEYLRRRDPRLLRGFLAGSFLHGALEGIAIAGPVLSNCSACSSGLASVAIAATLLRSGLADVVIAGGYDPVSEYAIGGFGSLRLLARGDLRPFCRERDGMKLSEAYAALVLERAEDARTRTARPLGYVEGCGESSDAHHLTQPHPDGLGAARAMRSALDDAGATIGDVGLVVAHATGTPNNDASECAAMRSVFGSSLEAFPVVAFKSHLGHTLGAAGAAELILALKAMEEQRIPPTAGIASEEIEFSGLRLNCGEPREARVARTMNLSLGFGGSNACVIVSREQSHLRRGTTPAQEVVITGLGVVLPGIVGVDALVARLADGRPGEGGPVPEEDYAHLVNTRRVRRLSDYVKTTIAAATDACRAAGILGTPYLTDRCHALLGTMACSTTYCESYYREIVAKGIEAANPMLFAEGVPNAAAAHLSLALGLTGSCQSIIGTRTAGLDALGLAWAKISSGSWERAIVSAGEEYHDIVGEQLRLCGHGRDRVARGERPRPFAAGAVAIVLESHLAANRRGAKAIARVDGWAARIIPGGPASTGAGRIVGGAWAQIGSPPVVLCSSNAWPWGSIEWTGIGPNAEPGTGAGLAMARLPEALSATPLIDLAGWVASDVPSGGPAAAHAFGVVATDPAGYVSAVGMTRWPMRGPHTCPDGRGC